MKKILLFCMMSLILFCSCNGCQKEEKLVVEQGTPMVVQNVISTDKEAMYLINKDYRWFETLILLNDYLDEENDGSIAEVVNIFQAVRDYDGQSADVKVYKFQHLVDGVCLTDSINGFWVEDVPIADTLALIPYEKAYELINEVNLPKPHSRHVCLRNPLGPISVNPQWVFGNIHSQLWVDAVTGDIKESNPAFPENLSLPLGEWP